MKVSQIDSGTNATYEDMVLQPAQSKNAFGDLYYFKDTIFLVEKDGVIDYVGQSKLTQKVQLTLNLTPALKAEHKLIIKVQAHCR